MSRRNSQSRKPRDERKEGRRSSLNPSKARARKRNQSLRSNELSGRQQDERLRCFEALNLCRSGKVKSLSAAARMAGTTVRAMRKSVPAAITQKRPGGRIHVKTSDRYSAKVQILKDEGAITTTARGSRVRELAGQHRATVIRVLRGLEPKSALDRYRGKKVGGHELISDYSQLSLLAQAGVLGQLESLYVSPDAAA
jgi:hypothetical protein